VTAAFTLDVLARLNRELGADFALDRFRHRAFYAARRSTSRRGSGAAPPVVAGIAHRVSRGARLRVSINVPTDTNVQLGACAARRRFVSSWLTVHPSRGCATRTIQP
jgi:hypothetical protein